MLAADHHQSIAPRHYDMPHVNIEKLERAHLATQPFEHTVIPAFLDRCTIERINETFPLWRAAHSPSRAWRQGWSSRT